ncbi:MAG: hypothetical protein IJR06_01795 [Paludibacteraceae bacterium]|nr:hypothetical protein [Paludibacteraceae bacterium]
MRRFAIALLLTAFISSASAYDYPYLVFQNSDFTETAVSVESLTLSISGDQIIATNNDGTQSFTLSNLNKMEFSTTTTNVTENTTDESDPHVEIYNLTGIHLGGFDNIDSATASLQRGIYIVKGVSETYKIAVR